VEAALAAGREAASLVGKVKIAEVIARPHAEILKFLYTDSLD
jgi:microcompartment protein CcmL/EutN